MRKLKEYIGYQIDITANVIKTGHCNDFKKSTTLIRDIIACGEYLCDHLRVRAKIDKVGKVRMKAEVYQYERKDKTIDCSIRVLSIY